MGGVAAGLAMLGYSPLAHMVGGPAAAVMLAALTISVGIGTTMWLVPLKPATPVIKAEDGL